MGATKEEAFTVEQLQLATLFKAMGHPARIAILQKLAQCNGCIGKSFLNDLDLAQPTISRHLQELKAAGLISGKREGAATVYCISKDFRSRVDQFLSVCC